MNKIKKIKTFEENEAYKSYMKLYMRDYRNTQEGYKKSQISKWKCDYGLIGDYDAIYERYKNTTHCDLCNVLLTKECKGGTRKQMEHNHSTGEFRNIVCQSCNCAKTDKKKQSNNTSGYKGVGWNKKDKIWTYRIQSKNKRLFKSRKNKIDILVIKFAAMILYHK